MTSLGGLVLGGEGSPEMAEVGGERSASQYEVLSIGVIQSREQGRWFWRLCATHRDMEDSQTALPIHEAGRLTHNMVDTDMDTKSAEFKGK